MNFDSFISDMVATITGGAVLTFIFFLLREKVYAFVDLDGSWVYEQKTITSEYLPYIEMTVCFLVLLTRDGNRIYGSAEKVHDLTADGGERQYIGKNRSIAEISGHIEKRYFSKDRISIHIIEYGEKRRSSTFHILVCESHNLLSGRFSSTISNQQGIVTWTRRSS